MEKEKKRWKWLSENQIPHSNSLKPFEFERNTDIGDINSRSSGNEEKGAEAVVWRCSVESMLSWISQNSQETPVLESLFKESCRPFAKFLRTPAFYRTPPMAASVGAEYKVKRISNSEWCECSTKAVNDRCSSK